jgi:hypothetical protein
VSRKLVELYVACLAIHCGHNVELDHPVSSKGDNPDIMLDYGAFRWEIAIKACLRQWLSTIASKMGCR